MRWEGGRRSSNIEDRRGMSPGRGGMIGGGLGTLVLVLLVAWFFGVDPAPLLQNLPADGGGAPAQAGQPLPTPGEDPQADFVATVLGYTEDNWSALFQAAGRRYTPPRLVLFSGATRSACGMGEAAMGPFYCPADQQIYIDLDFFRELAERFRAPGEFAQAYVIAHEVGHHVQNLLGTSAQVQQARRTLGEKEANALSVRVELQADCLAGVWAKHADEAQAILERGDIETALAAATAIGDDRLQQQGRGYVTPDSFTHGSSAQRVRWFRRGIDSGDPARCDTFSAQDL
ncbi:MAG: zinc metallopeptidase [Gammaproteobacteria bacterium]|nr:zinc metallopeptidase [Gammaproteobacteria bacterium]